MIDGILSPGTIALGALISWLSAFGLVYAADHAEPKVNALTERAVIAVIISIFLSIYAFVAGNTNAGFEWFPFEDGVRILRVGVLALSLIGPTWLVLWWTGRLGDEG